MPRGFTLIELMVTIAVAAILLSLAVPSFVSFLNSNKLSSNANELMATLQAARMESIRRNVRVVVCRSENATVTNPSCDTSAGNWGGWVAFVDTDGDGVHDAAETVLRANTVMAPVLVTASPAISGASNNIVFRSDGLAHQANGALLLANLRVCIATTQPAENVRDVSIASGSRVSIARSDAAGACPAPPDPA